MCLRQSFGFKALSFLKHYTFLRALLKATLRQRAAHVAQCEELGEGGEVQSTFFASKVGFGLRACTAYSLRGFWAFHETSALPPRQRP